jgi:two-component sensor histidine kinase
VQRVENSGYSRIKPAIRTWVFLLLPLVTFVLASTDALLLAYFRGDASTGHWKVALATTIPLSAAACGLTYWILIRLRNEIDRRALSESQLRTALAERDQAIADLSQGLEREKRLRSELDHRVRNNLSSLLGLVSLYEGSSIEPADLVRSLRGRISALREVYGLISAACDEGVDLAELLTKIAAMTTRESERAAIRANGPPVRLLSREANALAMVLQELFTNAGKHGALRLPGGVVEISWSVQSVRTETRLALHWAESQTRSPAARAQKSGGLGLALVEGIVRSDLRGQVSFERAGGSWIVDILATLASPTVRSRPLAHPEVCST